MSRRDDVIDAVVYYSVNKFGPLNVRGVGYVLGGLTEDEIKGALERLAACELIALESAEHYGVRKR